MLPAMRFGLDAGMLAEEIVLLSGGEGRVRVRAADQAELVWVHTKLGLEREAGL